MKPTVATVSDSAHAKELSDEQFLEKYLELDRNQSKLAEELGVSRHTVIRRLKRLNTTKLEPDGASSGRAAVVVKAEITHAVTKEFNGGVQQGINDLRTLSRFAQLYERVEKDYIYLDELSNQIGANGKRKFLSNVMKLKTPLVREMRGLLNDAFTIKTQMFSFKVVLSYMAAVNNIVSQFEPDIQDKIYSELSRIGFGEIAYGADEEPYSTP